MMSQNYIITLFRIRVELTYASDWPLLMSLKELQTLETSKIGGLQFKITSHQVLADSRGYPLCTVTEHLELGAMIVIMHSLMIEFILFVI